MTLELAIELVVISLLVTTIVYAVILNKRLGSLKTSKEELSKMMESFFTSINAAQASVDELKRAASSSAGSLKKQVDEAKTLYDDLNFMVERANVLASSIENMIASERQSHSPDVQEMTEKVRPLFQKSEDDADNSAQDILKALKEMR